MKNTRKYLIIIFTIFTVMLSSCAPSPMVKVVSHNSKIVEKDKTNSSKKDVTKKQSAKGNKIKSTGSINKKTTDENMAKSEQSGTGNSSAPSSGQSTSGTTGTGNGYSGSSGTLGSGGSGQSGSEAGGKSKISVPGGDPRKVPKDIKYVAAGGIYADMVKMLGGTLVATSQDNLNNKLFRNVFKINVSSISSSMPGNGQAMTKKQAAELASLSGITKHQLLVVGDSMTFYGSEGSAAEKILENSGINTYIAEDSTDDVNRSDYGFDYIYVPFKMVIDNVSYLASRLDNEYPGSIDISDKLKKYYQDNAAELYSNFKNENLQYTQYVDNFGINSNRRLSDIPGNYNEYIENLQYAFQNSRWTQQMKENGNQKLSEMTDEQYSEYMGSGGQYSYYKATYLHDISRTGNNLFTSALKMVNVQNIYGNDAIPANINPVPGISDEGRHLDDIIVGTDRDIQNNEVKLIQYDVVNDGRIVQYPTENTVNLLIQPVGIHSWTSGSPESILEPMWLATIFRKDSVDYNIDEKIRNFYNEFYHHDLSTDEIRQIHPDSQ